MIERIARGNRLFWLLSIIALPIPAMLAYLVFPIGCLCDYGAAKTQVFEKGIYLIWVRLLAGLILGEHRNKLLLYMAMPFVVGIVAITIAAIMKLSH